MRTRDVSSYTSFHAIHDTSLSLRGNDMYRVAVKDSATKRNAQVEEITAREGDLLEFASRREAEAFEATVCTEGGSVRLQASAAQDPSPVDAYLVKDAQANEWEPIETDDASATFPVGANVFGSIGLAIIYLGGKASPALCQYFTQREPASKRGQVIDVELEPSLPDPLADFVRWHPDLRIEVSDEDGGSRETYFAEVKSGSASFQRNQRVDMQRVAEAYGVLKIRVALTELPDRYTVRIHEVRPDRWPGIGER